LLATKDGSVANDYKELVALIWGQNYPAKGISCLKAGMFSLDTVPWNPKMGSDWWQIITRQVLDASEKQNLILAVVHDTREVVTQAR
jgi:hypothetical protein